MRVDLGKAGFKTIEKVKCLRDFSCFSFWCLFTRFDGGEAAARGGGLTLVHCEAGLVVPAYVAPKDPVTSKRVQKGSPCSKPP